MSNSLGIIESVKALVYMSKSYNDFKDLIDVKNGKPIEVTISPANIKVVAQEPIFMPVFKSKDAVGADVRAYLKDEPDSRVCINPYEKKKISLGIKAEIPPYLEMQLRSRSGFSSEFEVIQITGISTIDPDYRGTIYVTLKNLSQVPVIIEHGDRIAQAVIALRIGANYIPVQESELSETERGSGGHGHSGVK